MGIPLWKAFFGKVAEFFKPIADTIDNLHTSEEERLQAKAQLTAVQAEVALKWMEMEQTAMDLQARIVEAEMGSDSWLTKNWRPLTMLSFLVMIWMYWFGIVPPNVTEKMIGLLFEIIKWGLSGYIVGRSAEKVVPKIVDALKKPEG